MVFADRLKGGTESRAAWTDSTSTRVCKSCDKAAADLRFSLLSGISVAAAKKKVESGQWDNTNFWRPLPGGFDLGGMLPVHAAVCSGSLPLLKYLVDDFSCPLDGGFGLTAGDPMKSVLRVAVEHAAVEILEFLITTENLVLKMPPDLQAPVAVRALEAALRDSHKLRTLLDEVLNTGGGGTATDDNKKKDLYLEEKQKYPSVTAFRPPTAPPMETTTTTTRAPFNQGNHQQDDTKECVVCFATLNPKDRCALVPCGHTSCCFQCAGGLGTCPLCRSPVDRAMRIFVE